MENGSKRETGERLLWDGDRGWEESSPPSVSCFFAGGMCTFKDLPVLSDLSWQQHASMQSACKLGCKVSKEGELAKWNHWQGSQWTLPSEESLMINSLFQTPDKDKGTTHSCKELWKAFGFCLSWGSYSFSTGSKPHGACLSYFSAAMRVTGPVIELHFPNCAWPKWWDVQKSRTYQEICNIWPMMVDQRRALLVASIPDV